MENKRSNIAVLIFMTLLAAFLILGIQFRHGFFNAYGYLAIACGVAATGIVLYELFKPREKVQKKEVETASKVNSKKVIPDLILLTIVLGIFICLTCSSDRILRTSFGYLALTCLGLIVCITIYYFANPGEGSWFYRSIGFEVGQTKRERKLLVAIQASYSLCMGVMFLLPSPLDNPVYYIALFTVYLIFIIVVSIQYRKERKKRLSKHQI